MNIKLQKKNLQLYTYVFILSLLAIVVLAFLIKSYQITDITLLIVFSILSAIAETFLIPLPVFGAISVSFALTFSSILLTDPLTAAIITVSGVFFRCPYVDGRGRVNILNSQIYKTIFNISQSIINAGIAGVIYVYTDKVFNFGFDFYNPIAGLLTLIVYLLLNSCFMAKLMSIILAESFANVWRNYLLGFINIALVSLLGIVIAFSYNSYSLGGILLFFIPLLLARYTFKLYLDMRKNYFDTINMLIRTIEANDPYTSGHSMRVSNYAESIARKLNLPQNKIDILKSAALLHDIGKIGIDKKILNKTGKLEDYEFEIIKKHSEIGATIISDLSYMANISDIIKHHHERNDGKGYPDGLSYNNIPLETSILTIADSFDAMTSDRPYRYALSLDDALEQIMSNSGTQFNPDITDNAIIALKETYLKLSQLNSG
ncbi:HD-GYP domain-containing protein [Sedimentibacter sp. MB31-C6]|uniref:HD-GYP domain-containing protein n=1 Tax=Sedimentibacter sp. MB31-C6 TaxID=3109366 RepID=UPI002DDCEE8B|nr:HD-GYP domain-containing protein [Sedimentibacter sp. MB36-C1]WSI04531.1 HD-GYP domain-containing protein [Sedimentibacter sp. MB36-C1]